MLHSDGVAGVHVAAVADEAAAAHAAAHRVARPVPAGRAVARLHAVVAEVALRADWEAKCDVENNWGDKFKYGEI